MGFHCLFPIRRARRKARLGGGRRPFCVWRLGGSLGGVRTVPYRARGGAASRPDVSFWCKGILWRFGAPRGVGPGSPDRGSPDISKSDRWKGRTGDRGGAWARSFSARIWPMAGGVFVAGLPQAYGPYATHGKKPGGGSALRARSGRRGRPGVFERTFRRPRGAG
jgi:hypothetical protein